MCADEISESRAIPPPSNAKSQRSNADQIKEKACKETNASSARNIRTPKWTDQIERTHPTIAAFLFHGYLICFHDRIVAASNSSVHNIRVGSGSAFIPFIILLQCHGRQIRKKFTSSKKFGSLVTRTERCFVLARGNGNERFQPAHRGVLGNGVFAGLWNTMFGR